MKVMAQTLDDPVAAGDEALSRGDWTAARDSLRRALEIDESSGPAWEGLGWASWWLCDEEATFEANERAFRAYRAAGDKCGAARAATWLASAYLDFRGEDAIAVGWLERARRLLDGVPECADHGYLKLVEADLLRATGGAPAEAERGGQEAVRLGRALGVRRPRGGGAGPAGRRRAGPGPGGGGAAAARRGVGHRRHRGLPAGAVAGLDAVLHHHRLRGSGRLRARGPMGRGDVQDRRALGGPPHERHVPQRLRQGARHPGRLAGRRQRAGGRGGRHRAHAAGAVGRRPGEAR